jgi:hypothetical protein
VPWRGVLAQGAQLPAQGVGEVVVVVVVGVHACAFQSRPQQMPGAVQLCFGAATAMPSSAANFLVLPAFHVVQHQYGAGARRQAGDGALQVQGQRPWCDRPNRACPGRSKASSSRRPAAGSCGCAGPSGRC